MTEEKTGVVQMMGKPMTLLGPALKDGDLAPEFVLLDNTLKPVNLNDSTGKIRLISIVPSLDTEVCAIQTEHFSKAVSQLTDNVVFYTVSMDLPFAQKRWLEENEINNVITLSDFNSADFGLKFGVLLKELRLLTRAVVVVDQEDKIANFQIVPEITEEPNYSEILDTIKKLS